MSGPHKLTAIEIDNASLPAATAEIVEQVAERLAYRNVSSAPVGEP